MAFLKNPLAILGSWMGVFVSVLSTLSGLGLGLIMFLFFVFTMMGHKDDALDLLLRLLVPASTNVHNNLGQALRDAFEGVFFFPLQLACVNATITLVSFTLLGMRFCFFATSLVFLLSLVPLANPLLVSGVWALFSIVPCFFGGGSWLGLFQGVALLAVNVWCVGALDDVLYNEQQLKGRVLSPLLTAFALYLGYAAFGSKGVMLGPFLVNVLKVVAQQRLDRWFGTDKK